MPNFRISDEEFIRAYMEHRGKTTIVEFARQLGYMNHGGAVRKRIRNMRIRGIDLPEWTYTIKPDMTGYRSKDTVESLNVLIGNLTSPDEKVEPLKKIDHGGHA
jgi:hypothetical protein